MKISITRLTATLVFFLSPLLLVAQDHVYTGSVVDDTGEPLPYATVIVQNADSVVVEAVITDGEGKFRLRQEPSAHHIVIVQYLSFETVVISGAELMASSVIRMEEKLTTIDDVVVRGERPLVRLIGNTLSYDAQELARNRIVNTAFDVLKELPGITGNGDELQLVGAAKFTIVLNGQISTLSLSQLYTLLKSTPASSVKRLNISYNAPAKYNFNGAVIEVELSDGNGYEGTTGELSADYTNRFYSSGYMRGNMNVEKEKYSLNFLGSGGYGRSRSDMDNYSRHYLKGEYYDIYQSNPMVGKGANYSLRSSGDFKLKDGGNINLSYYYSGRNSKSNSIAATEFIKYGNTLMDFESDNYKKTKSHLHNLHFQYDGAVTAGADYTRYNSPDRGRYHDVDSGAEQTDYRYEFAQKIDKINAFVNNTSDIKDWSLSYGLNFTTANSRNSSDYYYSLLQGNPYTGTPQTETNQSEYFANAFLEVNRQLTDKLNLKLGVKGEYQYANTETDGDKHNLWSEWTVYPDMSISYMASQDHILQFNITSDKSYPPYWALSATESQLNPYAYIYGNPNLKPSRSYEGQVSYVFKNKYVMMATASYMPDTFRQVPYQSEDELKMVYEYINFDFQAQYGFALVVPFKVGKVLSSRVVVNGVELIDRISDFHGMNIRNHRFLVLASLNNTIALYHGKKSKLDMQIDARYQGRAIQGILRIGEGYNLNAGLKWTVSDKVSASVKVDNILRRSTPRPVVSDFGNQYTRMLMRDFRSASLNLTWKFGQYKEKQFRSVDSSRFGKN